MNEAVFRGFVLGCFQIIRKASPFDSGNLRDNAITVKYLDSKIAQISIDLDIAPYMPYTNEPWVSSFWRGKQNPNLYWFDFAFLEVLRYLERSVGGRSAQMEANATVDEESLAKDFANKTGDYFPEDVWTHSEYISAQENAVDLFISRFNLIRGGSL